MTWAMFYLVCFLFGLTFSVLSLLSGLGHLHLPIKWHLHLGPGSGPLAHGGPHTSVGAHAVSTSAGVQGGHPAPAAGRAGAASIAIFPVNFFTVMAFLTWFGGTGYLLSRYSTLWLALGLLFASLMGIVGAAAIFIFITWVSAHEAEFEQEDSAMIGVLGRLSIGIRQGGTGEMIYSQGGTRHACAARSEEDGTMITKGTEVVVTRCDRGIAYVRRWEDMAREP